MKQIQKKLLFHHNLEIGRLQPNLANFHLHFLSNMDEFEKRVQTLESGCPYLEIRRRTITYV